MKYFEVIMLIDRQRLIFTLNVVMAVLKEYVKKIAFHFSYSFRKIPDKLTSGFS